MAYTLRLMQESDGPALVRLMEDDPPSKGMSMTTRFQADAWQVWTTLKADTAGVVAEDSTTGEIVGTATVSFEDVLFEGQYLPSAFLENLKVHHSHRGKGLGTQLAQWRIEQARTRFGENGVIMTGTGTDNTASINTMKKWCKQFFSPIQVAIRPPLARPPTPMKGVTVRAPETHEYEQLAEKANRFFEAHNLYAPLSAGLLNQKLKSSALNVHDYRIAVDQAGNILGGIALSNRGKLMLDEISNLPTPLKVANAFLHIVPADGRIRNMEGTCMWFTDLAAARYLWQSVRYQVRDVASSLSCNFDPRSLVKEVFQIKRWHMPKIELILAIHGPREMDMSKLVAPGSRG